MPTLLLDFPRTCHDRSRSVQFPQESSAILSDIPWLTLSVGRKPPRLQLKLLPIEYGVTKQEDEMRKIRPCPTKSVT